MKRITVLMLILIAKLTCAATLNISGRISAEARHPDEKRVCLINNGYIMEIHFGTIITDKIDGINYLTDVPLTLNCSGSNEIFYPNAQLILKYDGATASFTSDAVSTSVEGLGIKLQQNGETLRPGDSLIINETTPPELKAVPVKQPGKILAEGSFESFAVLVAEYE
ncbi:fimbrial protein [Salmonella enterica]|nr:fimbrial protein [Salmonella enterica]